MTFASPRKFWVATDESFISSFTATFCPLGLLLLSFVGHFPLPQDYDNHFIAISCPLFVIIICQRFNPPPRHRRVRLDLVRGGLGLCLFVWAWNISRFMLKVQVQWELIYFTCTDQASRLQTRPFLFFPAGSHPPSWSSSQPVQCS